jgi:hypothetical protein
MSSLLEKFRRKYTDHISKSQAEMCAGGSTRFLHKFPKYKINQDKSQKFGEYFLLSCSTG